MSVSRASIPLALIWFLRMGSLFAQRDSVVPDPSSPCLASRFDSSSLHSIHLHSAECPSKTHLTTLVNHITADHAADHTDRCSSIILDAASPKPRPNTRYLTHTVSDNSFKVCCISGKERKDLVNPPHCI